ncbi:MAG: hypothetical protein KA807_09385 [Prolixibacteraceae bacterium]|nr:hypothetical protein [Prolixibacteraceae bacterium]
MLFVILYILALLISAVLISLVPSKTKGHITIAATILMSAIAIIPSVSALNGNNMQLSFNGSYLTGEVPLVLDSLSAWFIIVISITFITSSIYGAKYMEAYKERKSNLSLHWICFLFVKTGLIAITVIQNSIVFLIAWEIMAVSAFFLVIFEGEKMKTIKAGMNYLIQSHLVIIFLSIAFIWVASVTGSFSFSSISEFVKTQKPVVNLVLMLLFFIGFGFKAGFIPFHTWLPHAHPAAPSHISGMMSGVLIKIGIYGILRMILLINVNYLVTGYIILFISVITGIYGVMQAIVQHNLKRLLAYHSIENIGIIGIGIGVGCIGIGNENEIMSVLGFSGALLHVLNHSLFKSLLFYSAGNVYQSTHTMNIEKFGGLIKKMPHTAILFLIAALAICGLPPFNGFVSEFLIYCGSLKGIISIPFPYILFPVFGMLGLALIGGLAILCFTKAFGSIFLGVPRAAFHKEHQENHIMRLVPMYFIVALILMIGIFPQLFFKFLMKPVSQFVTNIPLAGPEVLHFEVINKIGLFSLAFIILAALVFTIRRLANSNKKIEKEETWGCGYTAPNNKMQYTASSFVRSYRKLAEPVLMFRKNKKEITGTFPSEGGHEIHPMDKIEEYLIQQPLRQFRLFLSKFLFLQNGKLQFYVLYGMIFIMVIIGIPFIISAIKIFIKFLSA